MIFGVFCSANVGGASLFLLRGVKIVLGERTKNLFDFVLALCVFWPPGLLLPHLQEAGYIDNYLFSPLQHQLRDFRSKRTRARDGKRTTQANPALKKQSSSWGRLCV